MSAFISGICLLKVGGSTFEREDLFGKSELHHHILKM